MARTHDSQAARLAPRIARCGARTVTNRPARRLRARLRRIVIFDVSTFRRACATTSLALSGLWPASSRLPLALSLSRMVIV